MKKSFIILVSLILVVVLSGCGAKNKITAIENQEQVVPVAETTSENIATTPHDEADKKLSADQEVLSDENLFSYNHRKSFIVFGGVSKKIAYKKGSQIIVYDPANGKKENIFADEKLIDFDLSADGTLLAYSLKEDGFIGNADIYLKNLKTNKIIRLTTANNIVSFSPKIFPDQSKVAYISRIYDPQTKTFSDGEIRTIAANGDLQTSETLVKANLENQSACTKKQLFTPKIGINSISPDGKILLYWKNFNVFDCDLLVENILKSFDEKAFSAEKFYKNTFITRTEDSFSGKIDIQGKAFWFNDHDLLSGNSLGAPIDVNAITYVDKDQNKTWELYNNEDWWEKDWYKEANASPVIYLQDVLKDGNNFDLIYLIYSKGYFVDKLSFGQKIDLKNIENGNPFLEQKKIFFDTDVKTMNFLGSNFVAYVKQNEDGRHDLFLYDLKSKKTELIEKELAE